MRTATVIALLLAASLSVACDGSKKHRPGQPGAVGTAGSTGTTLTERLSGSVPAFAGREAEGARVWKLTRQFYQKREGAPAWIVDRKPSREMDELIDSLQAAGREGLDPAHYDISELRARRQEAGRGLFTAKGFDPAEAATLDVWLTCLYLRYASDLSGGLAKLSRVDPNWKIRPRQHDLPGLLQRALEQHQVGRSLQDLVPRHSQYVGLRDALARYREIAGRGGWETLPPALKLKAGQSSPAVRALVRRLSITGDYTGPQDVRGQAYGSALQEAVKRFQRRHGLEPDGTIGPSMVAAMNVPVEERIRELTLNLERWRWLPEDLGDRYVLVNIPEYRLEVWDHGQVPLSMRVVVGKKDTPTPIFADDMTHVVFAPYWNVPQDIVQKETLPAVMRDPGFLQRTNMEVLDKSGKVVEPATVDLDNPGAYRFRQKPGVSNSLGLVKFMFPNSFNVYLHDTPADSLFARATRSFSHGCVRLEEPMKLAQYVLADQPDWTPERIDAAMHAPEEHTVKLKQPLPVYLGYWTARVAADGILQFRQDLYGIDAMTFDKAARSSPAGARNRPASTTSRPR